MRRGAEPTEYVHPSMVERDRAAIVLRRFDRLQQRLLDDADIKAGSRQ